MYGKTQCNLEHVIKGNRLKNSWRVHSVRDEQLSQRTRNLKTGKINSRTNLIFSCIEDPAVKSATLLREFRLFPLLFHALRRVPKPLS